MFGFQRIGDLIWAAGDMQARGFLMGGTAGRTTLAGEGLQHQDGQTHLLAYPVPNLKAYDPAYAYEIAVIIQDGIKRMYKDQESLFYYLTLMNENYPQPAMPKRKTIKEEILKGIYRLKNGDKNAAKRVQLFGSGTILNRVLDAQKILDEQYGVAADVWSVTSYKELHYDGIMTDRWNMLNPDKKAKDPYVAEALKGAEGPVVAASDYVRALPESISKWVPAPMLSLGTDGYGRSDGRRHLRSFFEVDENYITYAALYMLFREDQIDEKTLKKAAKDLDIDPDKANPILV